MVAEPPLTCARGCAERPHRTSRLCWACHCRVELLPWLRRLGRQLARDAAAQQAGLFEEERV